MKDEKQFNAPGMEDKIPMLPVSLFGGRGKPKLPKSLAWITGVERLSKHFADVPQFQNLRVRFWDEPGKTIRKIAGKKPCTIFEVWYYVSTFDGSKDWSFSVYAVEASKRHFIRSLLEERAFPIVEKWMKTERTEVWLDRSHELHCIWDPVSEDITIKEE